MSKEKLNNMLKFTEYDHLQPILKPTSKTEIGGFAVLEGLSIKELLKLAAKKSGKSKKELKNLSPKDLKKLIGYKKDEKPEKPEVEEKEEKKDEKNESLIFEKKKASAKQLAARKKFMEMIAKKKGEKVEKEGKEDKKCKDGKNCE